MKAFNYIKDFLSIRKKDIFIVSFPKSGNTRFRMALAKYYELTSDFQDHEFSYQFVNSAMPEIGKGNVRSARRVIPIGLDKSWPLFIKSHLNYPILRFFRRSNKVIYIQRPNEETLMSFYDYSLARGTIDEKMTFGKFIRSSKKGVIPFKNHLKIWNYKATHIIDYEELLYKDVEVIITALKKVGVKFDQDIMTEAIIQTRRKKIEKISNIRDKGAGYNFAAEKKRSLAHYFTDEDKKFYNSAVKNSPLSPIRN